LARRLGPTAEGLIHVPLVDGLPVGATRDELAAAGLGGWACVVRLGAAGESILGFDVMEGGTMVSSAELSLLRMALDALSNAVDRECLERERTRLETNLYQARRMETIGTLASGIAHNFNNIVGAILGYTEMAEAQLAQDSRPARHILEIRRAGERARYLVDQILAFGRRSDSSRRKPLCVRGMLVEARSLLHASLPREVELMVKDVPGMAIVAGELGQLQQVILNLCNNAAQAMDEAGCIEIETQVFKIVRPRALSHGAIEPGLYVCIAICDTGRGMDEATLERIFEPFFTTRLAGYGLGLATVREIVREHGGAMNVRSTPGCGSRFEAWLPSAAGSDADCSEDQADLPLGHGQTVLVVNDEREGLLRDEEMLAALGYEPVGFLRPADAVAACRVLPDRFDALVIGHLLPVALVIGLAAALHEIVPDLPIVLATATMIEISAETLAAARIAEIVHRPLASDEIAAALRRCIAGVLYA
jgi:signal transduction histidine kinase/CheY-like chemotaxis protein